MRQLVLKIHLVIALIAGAFMVLLGVTGSILAFEPELDHLFHRESLHESPGSRALSLEEIGRSVSGKFNGDPVVAFYPSASPGTPTEVILSRGVVSVDPYTGEVLGLRTRGQTFLGLVRALHVQLALGDAGRNLMRWSAVAMTISLASGIYLWWPAKRLRVRGPWWNRTSWFDLHNAIGILSLLPLLALALTGTIIGFEDQTASLLDRLTGSAGSHGPRTLGRITPQPDKPQITPDQAVAIASAQLPGAVPYRVQMPRYGGRYVVDLNTQARLGGDDNSISIDPWSGSIVAETLSADLTLRERLLTANVASHTGEIAGLAGRILVAIAGLLLPVQLVSGILIWRRRSPGRASKKLESEPA